MIKWNIILFLLFLTFAYSCKFKTKCNCSNKNVCISFINSSGQSLGTLKLLNKGITVTTIEKLSLNDNTCMSFDSFGESAFSLSANLETGKTITSSEVYCESGYKFIATATKDEIKLTYKNSY